VKSLELLGLEQGMFERKHKHLHAKQNPLAGNPNEIIGRLGVLLDQLSDRDLESLGLQRITVVEAVYNVAIPIVRQADGGRESARAPGFRRPDYTRRSGDRCDTEGGMKNGADANAPLACLPLPTTTPLRHATATRL
jgi:hypothetical protein